MLAYHLSINMFSGRRLCVMSYFCVARQENRQAAKNAKTPKGI